MQIKSCRATIKTITDVTEWVQCGPTSCRPLVALWWNFWAETSARSASLTAILRTESPCCHRRDGVCRTLLLHHFLLLGSVLSGREVWRAHRSAPPRCLEPWRSGHRAGVSGRRSAGAAAARSSEAPRYLQHHSWEHTERNGDGVWSLPHMFSSRRGWLLQLSSNWHFSNLDGIVATQSLFCLLFSSRTRVLLTDSLGRKSGALSRSGSQSASLIFHSRIGLGQHGGKAEQPDC